MAVGVRLVPERTHATCCLSISNSLVGALISLCCCSGKVRLVLWVGVTAASDFLWLVVLAKPGNLYGFLFVF